MVGSIGYLDLEYCSRKKLTEKSDVYSFGVFLYEVLCARPALDMSLLKEQAGLANWVLTCQQKGVLEENQEIMDPRLKGMMNPKCLKRFTELAERCLADHAADRPTMNKVLWNLEYALRLQENPKEAGITQGVVSSYHSECTTLILSNEEGRQDDEDMDYHFNPEAVFADLVNQRSG
ncbi:Receptor-like protein kinase ANXUR2 [Ancistrocladus abbreviatus]